MFIKKRAKRERNERILKKIINKDRQIKDMKKSERLLSVFKKYKIVCFIGTNTIKICELNSQGKITRNEKARAECFSSLSCSSCSSKSDNPSNCKKYTFLPPLTEDVENHVKGRIISF